MPRLLGYSSRWLFVLVMVFVGFGTISSHPASAYNPDEVVLVPAGDPIQLAFATWMDPVIPYQDYMDAFDMAVTDYGPIKGFAIKRNDFDAGCDPTAGEMAAKEIITNTQNLGVIGPYCSMSTYGLAPVLNSAGMVMISYSTTFPDLSDMGWGIFNRTVVLDPQFEAWDVIISSLPSVHTWNDDFNFLYGRPPSQFARYVYDATTLLLTRINEVSLLDISNNLLVDRSALASAVRNTTAYMGVTGDITLKPNGDRVNFYLDVIVPAGGSIQIAFTSWMTSTWPFQDYMDAFDMAGAAFGPIKGFDISRNDYDAGCTPEAGTVAAMQVISETHNVGMIGPLCTSSTRGMAPLLEDAEVVMISYANTGTDLGAYGWTIFNRTVVMEPFVYWDAHNNFLPDIFAWNKDFYVAYGHWPDTFAKYVYDATTLLLTRLDEVSTLDNDGNLLINRAALATAVRNTPSFMGITGEIILEADGDRVNLFPYMNIMPQVQRH